jgi:hypothetical protein
MYGWMDHTVLKFDQMAIEFLKIDPPKMMGQIPLPFEVIRFPFLTCHPSFNYNDSI